MKKIAFLLLAMACLFTFEGRAKDKKQQGEYDVYLLIGQSNMAGRGYMLAEDTLRDLEGVYILNREGEVVPARNPLNQYSTIGKSYGMQQIGPALGFAQKMYAQTGRKILLVVNARGGSSISEWAYDNEKTKFYSEAVRRTEQAMQYGKLKAVLWHQGCSDSSDEGRELYMGRLEELVSHLRKDLKNRRLYFVVGELGYWRPSSAAFNEMLGGVSDVIRNSDCISAEGAGMRADKSDPHFSRDGQLLLGERYAQKVLEKIYKK